MSSSKSKIENVEFSLGKQTLFVTVKDENGHFVDSKFFQAVGPGAVLEEAEKLTEKQLLECTRPPESQQAPN